MKKTLISALMGFGFIGMANAADMTIYYSPTCPHCHHAQDFTKNNFIYEYPTMKVTLVDVTVPEHRSMFMDVLQACDFSSGGVPVIKIGEKCFQGFGESMADELRAAIEVDMPDEAKKSAADVKKAIEADAEKYRAEHSDAVATVTEYIAEVPSPVAEPETAVSESENTPASDEKTNNGLIWWVLGALVLVAGVALFRKKSKK